MTAVGKSLASKRAAGAGARSDATPYEIFRKGLLEPAVDARAPAPHASREFLEAIIEHIPAVVFVKRAEDLTYVLLNRAAEPFFGKSRNEMIGRSVHDFFSDQNAAEITARDKYVLNHRRDEFRAERSVDIPGVGRRIVKTRRLPILDEAGRPEFLVGLIEDVTDRREAEARIAYLAFHDTLTGLSNRTAFNESIGSSIDRAALAGTSLAVLCLDVDRFKEINDAYGHPAGDALLCEIALRLRKAAQGAFIARMGGDEFALIVREADGPAPMRTCERIHEALAQPFCLENHCFEASASIGVAIYPTHDEHVETLLRKADTALYCAKAAGRARTKVFEPKMDARLHDRIALRADLHAAISRDEFVLHYQPQAEIEGPVIGFEALVRWRHPRLGVVLPGNFIPLAEETGLIVPLGDWVLRAACQEAAGWRAPLGVAINVSAIQLREEGFSERVHSILLETGLPASRLELEITEGVLLANSSRSVSILRRLKSLGVRIAMDDFGAGYSSLSYLQSFPFDKIKIDRSFIAKLTAQGQSAVIVRAMIGLGRSLGLPVIAEGVETEDQRAFLARESCDQMQGYLLGPPRPIAEYAELLTAENPAPPTAASFVSDRGRAARAQLPLAS